MRHLGHWLVLGSALLLCPAALAQEDDLDGLLEGADLQSMTGDQIKKALEQGPPEQQQGPPREQQQGPPEQRVQGPPAQPGAREQRVQQQGPPRQPTGTGEIDDLSEVLDPVKSGTDAVADETQVRPSTPQAGRQIDQDIQREIQPLATQITDEQREWSRLSPDEQARRLEQAKRSLREFAGQVANENVGMANALRRVADQVDGPGVAAVDSRGYGNTISPRRTYDASGETGLGANGEGQHRWWEKLLATVVEGVAGGVKGYVATTRMNELKARADRLAMRAGIENRPFVDARVRQAVDSAGLSRLGYDKRLDDLLLGSNRGGPLRAEPSAPPTRVGDVGVARGSQPVPRLPRVRDPITGVDRVQINMPLGADPVQPLMVRPR